MLELFLFMVAGWTAWHLAILLLVIFDTPKGKQ